MNLLMKKKKRGSLWTNENVWKFTSKSIIDVLLYPDSIDEDANDVPLGDCWYALPSLPGYSYHLTKTPT
jgi:hypothetical protein